MKSVAKSCRPIRTVHYYAFMHMIGLRFARIVVISVINTSGTGMQRYINAVHCAECPADFTNISSVNGCYKVVNHNSNWTAAGLECRSLHKDAHLLVINDAQEQSAVAAMLSSISRQCSFCFLVCLVSEFKLTAPVQFHGRHRYKTF